jgi:hypothetical protein
LTRTGHRARIGPDKSGPGEDDTLPGPWPTHGRCIDMVERTDTPKGTDCPCGGMFLTAEEHDWWLKVEERGVRGVSDLVMHVAEPRIDTEEAWAQEIGRLHLGLLEWFVATHADHWADPQAMWHLVEVCRAVRAKWGELRDWEQEPKAFLFTFEKRIDAAEAAAEAAADARA